MAVAQHNAELVEDLLSHDDVKPSQANSKGHTPLIIACSKDKFDLAMRLLKRYSHADMSLQNHNG